MPNWKKGIILIAVILLVSTGVWLYWTREMPLADALPDEKWDSIRLFLGDVDSETREWEVSASADAVLSAISETRVSRTGRKIRLTDRYFQLYLYPEIGYPTVIYVTSSGGIMVAANMDFDHYQYYKCTTELYVTLSKNFRICCGSLNPTPY